MSPLPIPGTTRALGDNEVFVIAEIGKNFMQTEEDRPVAEYLANAQALVKAAKDAGASAVKFQTHEVEDEQLPIDVVSPHFKGADRYSWVTRNTLATPMDAFWIPLKRYCDELDILFFSTPMSRKAAQKLEALGVGLWKVGSGDVQDYAMLEFLASTGKPVIISSGMVSLQELDEVIGYLRARSVPLAVLYCISKYPAPKEFFNLSSIDYLTKKYPDVVVGFSDHSLGDEVSLAAVKVGAKIIEKHFSLSREFWGSDHKVSMTPAEFKRMTETIRSGAYTAADPVPYWGTADRELEGAQNEFRPYFNKTLVAGRDIAAGEELTTDAIYAMRPRMAGIMPAQRFHDVVGKRASRALKKYEPLGEQDVA